MKAWLLGIGCAGLALAPCWSVLGAPAAPAASPASPAPSAAAAGPELIVGSKRGLEAWRWDGGGKRLISRGPARDPRWLDEGSVLVVNPEVDGNLARGARLERIALDSGKRIQVATLPPFAPDGGTDPDWSLDIQAPDDFVVDASGRFACVTLMDRNLNMMSETLVEHIDLATGQVSRWFDPLDPSKSDPIPHRVMAGKPKESPECSPRQIAIAAIAPGRALPFTFEKERIVEEKDGKRVVRAKVGGYSVEDAGASPSGRWLLLGGDYEAEDYIHRQLVLLDRATGDLFPIRPLGGTWPGPLVPAGKKAPRFATPVKNTASVVGETDVRWISRAPHAEILIVDGLVVRPGAASFFVDGQIAK